MGLDGYLDHNKWLNITLARLGERVISPPYTFCTQFPARLSSPWGKNRNMLRKTCDIPSSKRWKQENRDLISRKIELHPRIRWVMGKAERELRDRTEKGRGGDSLREEYQASKNIITRASEKCGSVLVRRCGIYSAKISDWPATVSASADLQGPLLSQKFQHLQSLTWFHC